MGFDVSEPRLMFLANMPKLQTPKKGRPAESHRNTRLISRTDVRYGIHIKSTNEFGIYSFFVFDDGRIHHSHYRSDPLFQLEQPLDVIPAIFEECSTKR